MAALLSGMYIPASYTEDDTPTLHAFMDANPFAIMFTAIGGASNPYASHLPLILDRSRGGRGTLFGHLARANPHARQLADGPSTALIVFTGPDAYITPSWYPTKSEHGRVVPTWNYIAVHVYGQILLHDDEGFLRPHLESLTNVHERNRVDRWQVSDAPDDFIAQQMRAIVGVEIPIDRIEGKWKMSQNRSGADIDGVVKGLSESPRPDDQAVAKIVAERKPERD